MDTVFKNSSSTAVPEKNSDVSEVFSKVSATKLPPHCFYDCSIDLIEGTLPKSRVYPFTLEEEKAMEDYINEALDQGFI